MPQDVTKSVKVTFAQSLPMGTRATFTVDKELWIAWPSEKNKRIFGVTDRLIGAHKQMIKDMIGMVNDHPEDAVRIAGIIERANAAIAFHNEMLSEKTESRVS